MYPKSFSFYLFIFFFKLLLNKTKNKINKSPCPIIRNSIFVPLLNSIFQIVFKVNEEMHALLITKHLHPPVLDFSLHLHYTCLLCSTLLQIDNYHMKNLNRNIWRHACMSYASRENFHLSSLFYRKWQKECVSSTAAGSRLSSVRSGPILFAKIARRRKVVTRSASIDRLPGAKEK